MTGDAADATVDPIVNLRDAHLIALYLHRASADRDEQLRTRPESTEHVAALATVEEGEGRVMPAEEETLYQVGLGAGQPPLAVFQDQPDDGLSGTGSDLETVRVTPITPIGFQEAARRLDPDFAHLNPAPAHRSDALPRAAVSSLGVLDAGDVLAQVEPNRERIRSD